ncbi:MAG: hypothetical protein Q8S29_07730, partial [Phreatobacter sp.]|nr:hypothetical protein [Phreatobacter sp.]
MDRLTLDRLGRAALIIALVLGVGSAAVSPLFRTANFGDGSLYLFSALTTDPWGVLWFNFPLRGTVFVFEILPSWIAVRLTGDAQAGLVVYSLIRGSWPLAGLLATMALEERGSVLSRAAAVSTVAAALPTTFFPTEIFVTHAFFWPFLAVLVRRSTPNAALVAALALPLAFSHEAGALLVISACLWSAAARQALRIQVVLGAVVLVWFATAQLASPPTAEMAHVMASNRLTFLLPKGLLNRVSFATMAAIAAFLIFRRGFRGIAPSAPSRCLAAGGTTAAVVYGALLLYSTGPIADERYTFRTLTFFAMAGASGAILAEAVAVRFRSDVLGSARMWLFRQRNALTGIATLVFGVTAVGQTIETVLFLRQWTRLER